MEKVDHEGEKKVIVGSRGSMLLYTTDTSKLHDEAIAQTLPPLFLCYDPVFLPHTQEAPLQEM